MVSELESRVQDCVPIVPLAIGCPLGEFQLVIQSELNDIVNNLPQPALCPDGVTAVILKCICDRHINVLLLIVNYSLEYA